MPAASAPAGRLRMVARQADYWTTVYRRTWRGSVFTSFLTPLFFVLAMGVLLGRYVESDPALLEGAPTYLAFIAPGLVVAHGMQIAMGEATWPVLGRIKWDKAYLGMHATPLSVPDIVAGHLVYLGVRVAGTALAFLLVLVAFGVLDSVTGVLGTFAVTLLVGYAFATPCYGLSAGLKDPTAFAVIYRVVVVPLFLFSGAFFPVSNLPTVLEWVAMATPLWHGVDLARMLTLDRLEPVPALVHVAYLVALAALGWFWSVRRLGRRLAY